MNEMERLAAIAEWFGVRLALQDDAEDLLALIDSIVQSAGYANIEELMQDAS